MRLSLTATILLLALATPALAPPGRIRATAVGTRCSLDLLHPIELEVRLEQALEPGKWVRATVRVQSSLDLSDILVRLEPTAHVELAGRAKMALSEIAARTPAEFGFDLRVPDTQDVLQVAVHVNGKAEGLPLERATVIQLLPRGPHYPGVESPALSGGQSVLEYKGAARRLP